VGFRGSGTHMLPMLAAGTVGALAAAAVGFAAAPAQARSADVDAQSVGRFLDGSAGGKPIQAIVDLKDARAKAPGTQSTQNPLDVQLGDAFTVPLTGKLQLPSGGLGAFGAVNQVAVAHTDGSSYGASGAVANSGGISVGGDNSAYPASASLTLSPSALSDNSPITIPGVPSAKALGAITASVRGVAALAKTRSGGKVVTPSYSIADVTLSIGSPLVGQVLTTVSGQLDSGATSAFGQLSSALKNVPGAPQLPAACTSPSALITTRSFLNGAVSIDPSNGAITISVAKLLAASGLNLNALPANTDLLAYLLKFLSSTNGLSAAVEKIITDGENSLETAFSDCLKALPAPVATALDTLISQLKSGQNTLTTAVNGIVSQLSANAAPLSALADGLKNVLDIGVNVQSGPGKAANNASAPFTSQLAATPDQATDVIEGQTLVRALEIDLLDGAKSASGSPGAVLALANAAVGPRSVTPAASASVAAASTVAPNSALPTGVPAGQAAPHHGTPVLPLVAVLLVVVAAGIGTVAYRVRTRPGGGHA
jgi:hypothetical protein